MSPPVYRLVSFVRLPFWFQSVENSPVFSFSVRHPLDRAEDVIPSFFFGMMGRILVIVRRLYGR